MSAGWSGCWNSDSRMDGSRRPPVTTYHDLNRFDIMALLSGCETGQEKSKEAPLIGGASVL